MLAGLKLLSVQLVTTLHACFSSAVAHVAVHTWTVTCWVLLASSAVWLALQAVGCPCALHGSPATTMRQGQCCAPCMAIWPAPCSCSIFHYWICSADGRVQTVQRASEISLLGACGCGILCSGHCTAVWPFDSSTASRSCTLFCCSKLHPHGLK